MLGMPCSWGQPKTGAMCVPTSEQLHKELRTPSSVTRTPTHPLWSNALLFPYLAWCVELNQQVVAMHSNCSLLCVKQAWKP